MLSFPCLFQGLWQIHLGAKLNEAATCYSWEGWDCFYLAVAGSDCNIILDMLSKLFSPPSCTELEDLDEPARKKVCTEAAAFEEEVLKQEGIPNTSQTKTVYPTSVSMSHTLGILADYFPTSHQAEECSKSTGQMANGTIMVWVGILWQEQVNW